MVTANNALQWTSKYLDLFRGFRSLQFFYCGSGFHPCFLHAGQSCLDILGEPLATVGTPGIWMIGQDRAFAVRVGTVCNSLRRRFCQGYSPLVRLPF
jgi:hypothetical protein